MSSHKGEDDRLRAYRQATSAKAVGVALGLVLLGGLLLWWSVSLSAAGHEQASAVVGQVGGVLIATGLLALAWDLSGKRAMAAEVFATAGVNTNLQKAGLKHITHRYLDDVEWGEFFKKVDELDIFVAYANTWRRVNTQRLFALGKITGKKIRIFMPDPDDALTVQTLAVRFETTTAELRATIIKARKEFAELATPGGADVEVWMRQGDVLFSCYRFDETAVVTLYSHSRAASDVPTLIVREGSLYNYIQDELEAIHQQSSLWTPETAEVVADAPSSGKPQARPSMWRRLMNRLAPET